MQRHPFLATLLILALGAVVYAQTVPGIPRGAAAPSLRYDVRTVEPSPLLRELRALRDDVRVWGQR